jgi:hypothetical protein
MSVIMTLTLDGDPKKLEEFAASNSDTMGTVLDSAKGHGLIAHRFYGSDEGQIMVVDEWPDAQSFQTFFDENSDTIGQMMQSAGITSEPQPKFWDKLDTHDEYGWGA